MTDVIATLAQEQYRQQQDRLATPSTGRHAADRAIGNFKQDTSAYLIAMLAVTFNGASPLSGGGSQPVNPIDRLVPVQDLQHGNSRY